MIDQIPECNCTCHTKQTNGGWDRQRLRGLYNGDYFCKTPRSPGFHSTPSSATPEELALGDLMRPSSPLYQPPPPRRRGARPPMPPFGWGVISPPGEPRRLVIYGATDDSIPYPMVVRLGIWSRDYTEKPDDQDAAGNCQISTECRGETQSGVVEDGSDGLPHELGQEDTEHQ